MTTDGFLEDGTLLVAMNGAAVSDMPPVFDVDTAVVTEDSSLIAKPVADGDSPPVAGGDVFVATNDDNRKRLARRNSNLTTWGKQARTAVACTRATGRSRGSCNLRLRIGAGHLAGDADPFGQHEAGTGCRWRCH